MSDQLDYHLAILENSETSAPDRLTAVDAIFRLRRQQKITNKQILRIVGIPTDAISDAALKSRILELAQVVWPKADSSPLEILMQTRLDLASIAPELVSALHGVLTQLCEDPSVFQRADIQRMMGELSIALPKSAEEERELMNSTAFLRLLSTYIAAIINALCRTNENEHVDAVQIRTGSFTPTNQDITTVRNALIDSMGAEKFHKWKEWLQYFKVPNEDTLKEACFRNILLFFVASNDVQTSDVSGSMMVDAVRGVPFSEEEKSEIVTEIRNGYAGSENEFLQSLLASNRVVILNANNITRDNHNERVFQLLHQCVDCFTHIALPICEKQLEALADDDVSSDSIRVAFGLESESTDTIESYLEGFAPLIKKLRTLDIEIICLRKDLSLRGELAVEQQVSQLAAIVKNDSRARTVCLGYGFEHFCHPNNPDELGELIKGRAPGISVTSCIAFTDHDSLGDIREIHAKTMPFKEILESVGRQTSFGVKLKNASFINSLGYSAFEGMIILTNPDGADSDSTENDPVVNTPATPPNLITV